MATSYRQAGEAKPPATTPGLLTDEAAGRRAGRAVPAAVDDLLAGAEPRSLPSEGIDTVRAEAATCTRCDLYLRATQTVFGEGPEGAPVMFVGEQPGDQEDLVGRPFVGPAGKLFDRALAEAGIDRARTYVTNAVKHFKYEPRGKKRIHQKPNAGEVRACRWWLDRELALVRPKLVVALGATAVLALAGRALPVTRERGRATAFGERQGLITVHPSFLLRLPDRETAAAEYARFVADLRLIGDLVAEARLAA